MNQSDLISKTRRNNNFKLFLKKICILATTGDSDLVTGPAYEAAVSNLCEMGFSREEVFTSPLSKKKDL